MTETVECGFVSELPTIIGWLTAAKSADIAAALRRAAT